MRPAGEVRQALWTACTQMATPTQGVTLREMATTACVGVTAARVTVAAMHRAGQICKLRERRVEYRNRPVAEYVPAGLLTDPQAGFVDLASVLQVWAG